MNDRTDVARIDNPYGQLPAQTQQGGAMVLAEQQRAVAETLASMQIARANPRNPILAMQAILQDCSMTVLAEDSTYEYSRGGTSITGPSIRLAEAIARRWGNMRSGVVELARREGFSEVKAFAMDLETGYQDEKVFQVAHIRDTKQGGKALKDERDIYEHLANVAARRKRACILAIIPPDVVEGAMRQCEITLNSKLEVNADLIAKLVENWAEIGVTKEMIEKRIQRKIDALTPGLVIQLRRIRASIRDGMSSPAEWFDMGAAAGTPTGSEPEKPKSATDNVAGELAGRAKKDKKGEPKSPAGEAPKQPEKQAEGKPPAGSPVDPATGEILAKQTAEQAVADLAAQIDKEIAECKDRGTADFILQKIMKLPLEKRPAILGTWSAKVAVLTAPGEAAKPTPTPTPPPPPAGGKQPGTKEQFDKSIAAMKAAKTRAALEEAADFVSGFIWPEPQRVELNNTYNSCLDPFVE